MEALYQTFFGTSPNTSQSIRFPDGTPGAGLNAGSGIHVALRLGWPLSEDGRWKGNISLGYDRQTHGALFLGDSYRLTLRGLVAKADLERHGAWSLSRTEVQTRLAIGLSTARYEASLRSSLLAVDASGWAHGAYLRAGLAIPVLGSDDPKGTLFETELIGHASGGVDLIFGLALQF